MEMNDDQKVIIIAPRKTSKNHGFVTQKPWILNISCLVQPSPRLPRLESTAWSWPSAGVFSNRRHDVGGRPDIKMHWWSGWLISGWLISGWLIFGWYLSWYSRPDSGCDDLARGMICSIQGFYVWPDSGWFPQFTGGLEIRIVLRTCWACVGCLPVSDWFTMTATRANVSWFVSWSINPVSLIFMTSYDILWHFYDTGVS